jgi:hypothetical protein
VTRLLSIAAVLLGSSAALSAQRNPVWSSIDLKVARADRVIVGHISSMQPAVQDRYGTSQSVTIAVDETLKGPPTKEAQVDLRADLWQLMDQQKLLCDTCAEHSHRLLVTIGHWIGVEPLDINVTDLDAANVLDVTGDLRLLTTGAAVLQAARDEVKRCPTRLDEKLSTEWGPTATFMPGTKFHGATIIVPIDARQEQLAHTILATQPPLPDIGYADRIDPALKYYYAA